MRSRVLQATVLAAVAGAIWTQVRPIGLRLRRLSLKCWLMGHDDWIRRIPDRLYLECFECGRETQGWATGTSHSTDGAGGSIAKRSRDRHMSKHAIGRRILLKFSTRRGGGVTEGGGLLRSPKITERA